MEQGQSYLTIQKEATIATFLRYTLHAIKSQPYFVFDLNCGCGENRTNGANCLGTGPLAHKALKENNVEGYLFLCDIRKAALRSLKKRFCHPQMSLFDEDAFRGNVQIFFIRMDNKYFVPTIPQRIRENGFDPSTTHGIIIADPNGLKVPLSEISACATECPRLDIVIHLCNVKRVWACKRKRPDIRQMNFTPNVIRSFSEIFRNIPNRSWLISKPFREHYLLFGSHLPWIKPIIGLPGRTDMYWISSPEAKSVITEAEVA